MTEGKLADREEGGMIAIGVYNRCMLKHLEISMYYRDYFKISDNKKALLLEIEKVFSKIAWFLIAT